MKGNSYFSAMKKFLLLPFFVFSSLNAQEIIGDVVDDGVPDAHYSPTWIRTQLDPPQSWILEREKRSVLGPAMPASSIYVSWNSIPRVLYQAVVAAEDGDFWQHNGLSYTGIARAAARNLMAGHVSEGGSTLTQQLAKNLYGRTQRDLANKMVEASRALNLEKRLSKQQIMEFYLNIFSIPGNKRGAGAAAKYWFNRPLTELNAKELVFIAATLKGPAIFDPFTQKDAAAKQKAQTRRDERIKWILGRMVEEGFINAAQANQTNALPLRFQQGNLESGEVVDRVREVMASPWWQEQLRSKGVADWKTAGLRIVTTIDAGWQNQLQLQERKHLDVLRKKYPTIEGAGVLSRWGQIWASVGGYQDQGFDRAFTAKRPLGSVWKMPLYALAFKYGWELTDTLVNDYPVFLYNNTVFQPKNSHSASVPFLSLMWAGVKSENIATIDLLYRLFEKTRGGPLWIQALADLGLSPQKSESPENWYARLSKDLGVKLDAKAWDLVRFERAKALLADSLQAQGRGIEALRLRVLPYRLSAKSVSKSLYHSGESILNLQRKQDSLRSIQNLDSGAISDTTVTIPVVNSDSLWFAADIAPKLYEIWSADTLVAPWSEANQSFYHPDLRLKVALRTYQKFTQSLGLRTSGEVSPSWILGAKEENLVRMTSAYAALFRGRTYKFADGSPWRLILRVEDASGRTLVNPDGQEEALYGLDVMMRVRLLLQGVMRSGTASGSSLGRNCKQGQAFPAGGKTGTANDSRTVAFVGVVDPGQDYWLTQDVWSLGFMSGRDDNAPLGKGEGSLSGAQGALTPFVEMSKLLRQNTCQTIQSPNFQGDYFNLDPATGFPSSSSKHRYWLPLPRPLME